MFAVVITEKGGAQRKMQFDAEEISIGRVQGNDIILPKGNVSKRHSKIVRKDGRFIVVDLKSTNGTYVNGRKITSPLVVKPGDKIYIGDFIIGIEEEEAGVTSGRMPSAPPPVPGAGMEPSHPDLAEGPTGLDAAPHMGEAGYGRRASSIPPGPGAREEGYGGLDTRTPVPPAVAPPPAPPRAAVPPRVPMAAPPRAPAAPRGPDPATTALPHHRGPVVASSPSPNGSALAMVMERVAAQFDVERPDAAAMRDQARWSHAQRVIEEAVSSLRGSGALDPSMELGALGTAALHEAVGLGPLEILLAQPGVHEIVVTGPETILVDRGEGLERIEGGFSSQGALATVAHRLLAQASAVAVDESAIQEVVLPDGKHLTVCWPPVAVRGPVLEIRNVGSARSLAELTGQGVLDEAMAGILERAVLERRNIFILGPVGSGVTTLLGALASRTDPTERLVTVEGIADLSVDRDGVIRLSCGDPRSGLSLGELVRQAGRLHCDRLVVDDVTGPEAFEVLTTVASRPKGSLVGVHATATDSPTAPLARLASLERHASPEAIADLIGSSVDVVVKIANRPRGRRVMGIYEVTGASGATVHSRPLVS